jgi:hypothetical protein
MRSLCFVVSRAVVRLAAAAGDISAMRRRGMSMSLGCLIALTLTVGVAGDDFPSDPSAPVATEEPEEEEPTEPRKPVIENFQAFFDGIDQYSVYGQVVDCEELEGLEIRFGGVFTGETTETGFDGWFYTIIIHEEATGSLAQAVAISQDGMQSEPASIELF